MPARLPLSALRAFEAAARLGAFRDAARELGLTPSAVSHAVLGLERALGAPLFARDRRAVRLTPEGEAMLRHAARGFEELRRGVEAVSAAGPQTLRPHCAPSFAAQWLVPRLARLRAACPEVRLKLSARPDYPRFPSEEFDADVVYGAPRQDGLVVLPLGEETVAPLCAPSLAGGVAAPADLPQRELIESEHNRVRWPAWFAANGLPPPPAGGGGPRFDRSFLAIVAAADGLGVALESTRLAERELREGRLVQPLAGAARDLRVAARHLAFPQGGERHRPLRRFADWLRAELGLPAAAPP